MIPKKRPKGVLVLQDVRVNASKKPRGEFAHCLNVKFQPDDKITLCFSEEAEKDKWQEALQSVSPAQQRERRGHRVISFAFDDLPEGPRYSGT
mmetsp:Transcript_38924/g.84325  ORF Transcript_38924/g.84325 Transcript_38924/m.84325 type:complete len:93 (+) Transcript_38924:2-280(+)